MMPAVGATVADLKLSDTPEVISYKTKTPWLVKCEGGDYVLTNANGPITIKATGYNRIDQHVSLQSRSNLYATGDSISAKIAKEGLMYVWDVKKQGFFCSDSVGILPNRFYAQYYNNKNKQFVTEAILLLRSALVQPWQMVGSPYSLIHANRRASRLVC